MSVGSVSALVSLGLTSISVKPNKRGFFPDGQRAIIPQATIKETHHDDIEITDNPVQFGAAISDHAYKKPVEVVIEFGFSNSPSSGGGILGNAQAILGKSQSVLGPLNGVQSALNVAGGLYGAYTVATSSFSGSSVSQIKAIYNQLIQLQEALVPFTIFTGKRKYDNMLFKSITVETDSKHENSLIVTATCRQVIIVNVTVVQTPVNKDAQKDAEKTSPVENAGTKSLSSATGRYIP